jgi:hypothetical protein
VFETIVARRIFQFAGLNLQTEADERFATKLQLDRLVRRG